MIYMSNLNKNKAASLFNSEEESKLVNAMLELSDSDSLAGATYECRNLKIYSPAILAMLARVAVGLSDSESGRNALSSLYALDKEICLALAMILAHHSIDEISENGAFFVEEISKERPLEQHDEGSKAFSSYYFAENELPETEIKKLDSTSRLCLGAVLTTHKDPLKNQNGLKILKEEMPGLAKLIENTRS